MTRRSDLFVLLVVLVILAVAGPIACGKRGRLEAPEGAPSIWPRSYPTS